MPPSAQRPALVGAFVLQPSDKEMLSQSVTSLDAPASSEQNGALTNGDSKFPEKHPLRTRASRLRTGGFPGL